MLLHTFIAMRGRRVCTVSEGPVSYIVARILTSGQTGLPPPRNNENLLKEVPFLPRSCAVPRPKYFKAQTQKV